MVTNLAKGPDFITVRLLCTTYFLRAASTCEERKTQAPPAGRKTVQIKEGLKHRISALREKGCLVLELKSSGRLHVGFPGRLFTVDW